jgi:flagellar hook-associated protein 3 FlgL
MRISTLSYMTSSLPGILDNQSQIARLSQQIATGQNYLSPQDNPLATQQAMSLSSGIAADTQYVANQTAANQTLSEESTVLQAMQTALNGALSLVSQSNGSLSQSLRDQNAAMLSGYYQQIKDLANSRDTGGRYLFAGFNTNLGSATPPFQHTQVYPSTAAPGSQATDYVGTPYVSLAAPQGVRSIAIADGRSVQVSDNLDTVFQSGLNSGNATGSTTDLLQSLDQLAITLHDSSLTSAQVNTALTNASAGISAALGSLQQVQSRVATAQAQINDTQATTKSQLTLRQNALSDLTLVNQASAIVELQSRQTSLQAAETAFSQTSKLSMFNYL